METFIITMTKYIVFLLFQSHRPIGILIVISMHAVYYLHSTCVSFCSNHFLRGRRGRDRMVVGFTTTCAHYFSYILEVRFIDAGNRSTRRKLRPTASPTLSHNVVSSTLRH
jgi:hypothetical protein